MSLMNVGRRIAALSLFGLLIATASAQPVIAPDWTRRLDGEAPGSIPIESPRLIHLALNRTSAERIGSSFPPSLLARADEVVV